MHTRAQIIATLTEAPTEELLTELSSQSEILEVRDDLVRGLDPDWLRSFYSGQLLYTLRSREEGGRSESSGERRHQRLIDAAQRFDLVDLELRRDLSPAVLDAVEPAQRIVSWHGPPTPLTGLQELLAQMTTEAARYYKLVPTAEQPRQEMAPLALLRSTGREDVIAFAAGIIGTWTRLVAPRLGAPIVFGAAGGLPGAPGQLAVDQLRRDFDLPRLHDVQELFGLVGAGIGHSLSPRLHNHLYRRLDLPYLYVPFEVEAFGDFWLEVVESGAFDELGFPLRGLSVTTPYKRIASAVGGACSPLVDWLGSANTLIRRQGVWEAESTDGDGVTVPLLERLGDLRGETAAVIGAGGAGRAAVAALKVHGVEVMLVNRTEEFGRRAAKELRVAYRSLDGFDPGAVRIVVHATPLGRNDSDPLVLQPALLAEDAVVIDMVYRSSGPTALVRETRAAGRRAVDGREVLAAQAVTQFRLMTGQEMPLEEAKRVVDLS